MPIQRNAEQIRAMPEPELSATGTVRISALLSEARSRRDGTMVRVLGEGGTGLRTGTPLDTVIEPMASPAVRPAAVILVQ